MSIIILACVSGVWWANNGCREDNGQITAYNSPSGRGDTPEAALQNLRDVIIAEEKSCGMW